MRITADTTVLNNFSQIRRPDLLRAAFPALAAPEPVLEELAEGERLGVVPVCDWGWLEVIQLTAAEQTQASGLAKLLDAGEAACLAVARARGWAIATDDFAARTHARRLGIEVTGTLGTLMRLVRMGVIRIDPADALLAEMIACGYRSPIRSLGDEPRGSS